MLTQRPNRKCRCRSADGGWNCTPFGVSELLVDGVSGTHFSLCLCDVCLVCQHTIKGDTKVCQIVSVQGGGNPM